MGFIYTSFQERATKVAHGNTARLAKEFGDETLAKLCGLIAADEGRHEVAYQRIVSELAQRDPAGVVLALAAMMRRTIVMPAHNMDDGQHVQRTGKSLFDDYADVADRLGVCARPAMHARCVAIRADMARLIVLRCAQIRRLTTPTFWITCCSAGTWATCAWAPPARRRRRSKC